MSLYDGLDIDKEDGGSSKPVVGKKDYYKLSMVTVIMLINGFKKWRKDKLVFPVYFFLAGATL